MQLLNVAILREPYNWIVVFLMCAFALALLALLFPEPTTLETSTVA